MLCGTRLLTIHAVCARNVPGNFSLYRWVSGRTTIEKSVRAVPCSAPAPNAAVTHTAAQKAAMLRINHEQDI